MSTDSQPLAVVIGGGSGIGSALVAKYRERSIRTVVWDVDGERDVTCDIVHPEQIDEAVRLTTDRWGVPDRVTVTAGIGHAGLLSDVTAEEWDRVMQTNARGPWLCLRAWAQVLHRAGRPGSFVATSSISSYLVDRNMGTYCASKAALNMLVKVAAAEWGPWHIRVNAIAPGVTMTPMLGRSPEGSPWLAGVAERTTLGRLGQADDIAAAVMALHDLGWVTGQVLNCDGGLSLQSPIDSYGGSRRSGGNPAN
ncbi:MAG TPA: SDR family oxidoreductase [Acidimicrobiales bacterium]|nr:SDR family oxidoreductase [Acidimicrobiales bacterium]